MPAGEEIQLDSLSPKDQIAAIPVDAHINGFAVENQMVRDALIKYPPLCYLLGRIEYAGEKNEVAWDKIKRDAYVVRDGSGMFGLTEEDDAMRWKGIFNHMVGSARNVYNLTNILKGLSDQQRQDLESLGYDFSEFDSLDADVLSAFQYAACHCSRRLCDERDMYNIEDDVHPQGSPGATAQAFLQKEDAPQIFQRLIEVEIIAEELLNRGKRPDGKINIVDALLTYADWTYTQRPITLEEGFADKKASARFQEHLDLLEELKGYGERFERDIKKVLGMPTGGLFEHLRRAKIPDFEHDIRAAYCAPSGLSPLSPEVFEEYAQRMSQAA